MVLKQESVFLQSALFLVGCSQSTEMNIVAGEKATGLTHEMVSHQES
jgi:hypothetical protein